MKPMLAGKAPQTLTFPKLASPKIDGIRAVVVGGKFKSRTLKDIPNRHIQSVLSAEGDALNLYDGELVVGSATDPNCMQATTSGVMSHDGEPAFTYFVFDHFADPDEPFHRRWDDLHSPLLPGWAQVLPQTWVHSQEELDHFEAQCLEQGYEGVMLRDPNGPYKFGRSTPREGYLLKVKRFEDAEALVIGFEELMRNGNAAETNELGYTQRSTAKDGLVRGGVLGNLLCRCLKTGVEFSIGTGFNAEQRRQMWAEREALIGRFAKYKHFSNGGVKAAPRFPTFQGFRSPIDM